MSDRDRMRHEVGHLFRFEVHVPFPVSPQVAAETAAAGYAYATDICDVLIGAGIDNRTSHRIVGRAIRDAGGAVIDLDRLRAAAAALDLDELGDVDEAAIEDAREPEAVVASRTGIGGAADAPLTAMLDELDGELAAARQFLSDPSRAGFEDRLLDRARRVIDER